MDLYSLKELFVIILSRLTREKARGDFWVDNHDFDIWNLSTHSFRRMPLNLKIILKSVNSLNAEILTAHPTYNFFPGTR